MVRCGQVWIGQCCASCAYILLVWFALEFSMSNCGDLSRRLLSLVLDALILSLILVRLFLLFNDVTNFEVRVEIFVVCIMYCS